MERSHLTRAAKYLADLRRRTVWRKVISLLSVMVVFCTVYALVLPAITMTRPTICGQEEHRHDAGCFAAAEPAPIDAAVALPRQVCGLESVYAGLMPEEHAGFIIHVHDGACYQDGMLICTLPEVPPHVHEEKCYVQERILICGQEEEVCIPDNPVPTEHFHTEECYAGVLACGQEQSDEAGGHVHTPDCYQQQLACGQEETGPEDEGGSPEDVTGPEEGTAPEDETGPEEAPGPEEGTAPEDGTGPEEGGGPEDGTGPEEGGGPEDGTGPEEGTDPEGEPGPEEGTLPEDETLPEEGTGHVHTDECYILGEYVAACGDRRIVHEHGADCRNEFGELICGWPVTREHVHGPECFLEAAPEEPGQEEPQPEEPVCGMTEHTHGEECYAPEEPEVPDQNQDQWDAIFWSGVVEGYGGGAVLDARVSGVWSDTSAMDPAYLEELRGAAEADLTRYLDRNVGIQVDGRLYNEAMGPMDSGAEFGILLQWSMSGAGFGTMTYTYQFPWQVLVEDVAKQVLNDDNGEQALTYSIQDNMLSITYYKPVESVTASFSLRASWAEDLGESTQVQWSNSAYSDVLFALPELTVEKAMGEDGLRVEEDGSVWADYAVTVANTGMVQAQGVVLTDTLEAERFHFVQGGLEDGGDYVLDTGDGERSLSFDGYDGGDILQFPAFNLAPGESRTYRYMARMTAEDREAVDAAVKAGQLSGETVRNTAVAVCPASGGELEFSASARATYGGPESKHVESFSHVYEAEAFQVTFTVNGDAQLPVGMTAEKLEQTTGQGLRLTVDVLDETIGEYQAFAQHVEEDENLLDLQVLKLGLDYNGVQLDLADCDITAAVMPSEALLNYKKPHVVTYNLSEEEKAEKEAGYDLELEVMDLAAQSAEAETPEVQSLGTLTVEIDDGVETPEKIEQVEMQTSITAQLRSNYVAVREGINPYPNYTVQFYANLDRPAKTGDENNKVSIIDTSGKSLPQNGRGKLNSPNDNALMPLYFEDGGEVQTTTELTQIFTERSRVYNPKISLNLEMLDNISYEVTEAGSSQIEDPHYKLAELWVLKDMVNGDPASTNRDDWNVYTREQLETIKFTNDPSKANDPGYIVVTSYEEETSNGTAKLVQTVFRMVYTPNTGSHTNEVNFYDYDISTTNRAIFNAYNNGTGAGINSAGNYQGTGAKYAFGNNNVGTPFGEIRWNEYQLNKFNGAGRDQFSSTDSYNGCTFGLVDRVYEGGKIKYMANSPFLFNDGSAEGKYSYDKGEYSLQFIRKGDTYTLSAVNGSGLSDLERLQKGAQQWTLRTDIWTNHFWPMDNALTAGTTGHDIVFGAADSTGLDMVTAGGVSKLPKSDNGQNHNNYFGMQASFDFTIPATYVGPMEYYFFGDDDLWVFLDGQLVCDLGGVKSSTAGEYVNLGEYIEKEDDGSYAAGTHRLDLYYTERGASGSTCWMQFTLPNIRSVPLDQTPDGERGSLRISKEVNGAVNKDQEYNFKLEIENVTDIFSVKKYDKDLTETVIKATEGKPGLYEFSLKAGESLAVFDLPQGKHFTITEIEDPLNACETTITSSDRENVVEGKVISGTSSADTTIYVTYTNTFYYALPETGGPGEAGGLWYAMAALPTIAAAGLLYKRSRKKGGTQF